MSIESSSWLPCFTISIRLTHFFRVRICIFLCFAQLRLVLDIILRVCIVAFDENHLFQNDVILVGLAGERKMKEIVFFFFICIITNLNRIDVIYLIEIAQRQLMCGRYILHLSNLQ